MSTSESGKKPESEGYLSAYHGYATTLRTRLVGYGIGCPAIILTQEPLRKAIWAASWNGLLTLLFLAGVLSQVVLAVVNKSVNCHLYYHSYRKERGIPTAGTKTEETRLYRFSNWIYFDLTLDAVSILCFAASVVWLAFLFFSAPGSLAPMRP